MTLKIEPFMGLSYNETYKALNWNVWNDENIISCSFYLSATLDGEMGSPPGAMYDGTFTFDGALLYDGAASDLVDGRTYLVSSPAAGDWAGQEGKLATVVEDTWKFYSPVVGQTMFSTVDGSFYLNTGDAFINKDDYGVFPSPSVSCTYAFNATSGDAIALGDPSIVGAMVASGAGKTATYTIQSAHATVPWYYANYVQFSAPFPTTVDLSTGKKVVEGVIDVSATLSGGTGGAAIGVRITTAEGAPIVFFATILLANGSTAFEIYNSAMASVSVPGVVYPATVGVTFDAVASTFALKVNGAEVDVSSINTYTPQVAVIVPNSGESTVPNAVDAADAGKTLSFTLHASVDDITQTYAAGTTDICGNTL